MRSPKKVDSRKVRITEDHFKSKSKTIGSLTAEICVAGQARCEAPLLRFLSDPIRKIEVRLTKCLMHNDFLKVFSTVTEKVEWEEDLNNKPSDKGPVDHQKGESRSLLRVQRISSHGF